MQQYVVFGLDEAGVVVVAERRGAASPEAAIELARRHLDRCHRIEVWSEAVCIHREVRAQPK